MSSSELDVVAILTPVEGKSRRVIEVLKEVMAYVQAEEPGTLKYDIHKDVRSEEIVMVEKYADMAALKKHGQGEAFLKFQKIVKDEGLLKEMPNIKILTGVGGLKRGSAL